MGAECVLPFLALPICAKVVDEGGSHRDSNSFRNPRINIGIQAKVIWASTVEEKTICGILQ